MADRLRAELQQSKPFRSLAEEAILNLERTADCFRRTFQQTLKPHGITATQYNALRILRGAYPGGLACTELGQRLVSSDPDITRLLARLMRQGLIERERVASDRRVVMTRIAAAGLSLLEVLDPIVDQHASDSVEHMRKASLESLIDLLEEARAPHVHDGEEAGTGVSAGG